MTLFSRFAVAAALLAGLGGAAHAQTHAQQSQVAPAGYYALSDGRSVVVDRPADSFGAVPPSESETIMGLRVPR